MKASGKVSRFLTTTAPAPTFSSSLYDEEMKAMISNMLIAQMPMLDGFWEQGQVPNCCSDL